MEQSEKMYYLHTLFFWEKCNYQKIKDISKSAKANTVGEVDLEEHKILYDTLTVSVSVSLSVIIVSYALRIAP